MDITSKTRRRLLAGAVQVCAAGLLPAAFVSQAVAQEDGPASGSAPARAPAKPGTWLVLLGTHAGPGIDLSRAQTASAVVVDGKPYLVDCGYGALRQLVAGHVGYLQIDSVFLTHLHDDHIGDLAALLSFQWTNGKTTPTDAYGPYGTASMVQSALGFFHANVEIRTVDEGRSVDATRLFHGHDVAAAATPQVIFKDDKVTVTAVENTHYPPRSLARMPDRSFAFRFDTPHRSIVFSGDTAYSQNLVKLAKNADVFVCEVMDQGVLDTMRRRATAAAAAGNSNNVFRHVADTHSSPADVARMATEANVRTVVLNHEGAGAAPTGALAYPVTGFIDAIRKGFAGEVIVGADLMVI
ncbi:MAG TPA: MBL fold metallo-hydrolase [Steroidobacteraceae bacterium]|nr:MBL fold metallo-hydrolase [Steroidobacteraceae bacterium]